MFRISTSDKIYIYGAGTVGLDLQKELSAQGFHVSGFLDRRAEGTRKGENIPVLQPQAVPETELAGAVIIVTPVNGLLHSTIVKPYSEKGCRKLLYLPMGEEGSLEYRSRMRFAYVEVVAHHNFEVPVPFYPENNAGCDMKIISDSYRDHISFFYPADRIYNPSVYRKKEQRFQRNQDVVAEGAGKKTIDLEEYKELFGCLKQDNATLETTRHYLSRMGRESEEDQKELLKDRQKLYRYYKSALRSDPSFFTDSPIKCDLEGDRLCIMDGRHRFFFLVSEGWREVPVITTTEVFHKLSEITKDSSAG